MSDLIPGVHGHLGVTSNQIHILLFGNLPIGESLEGSVDALG